MRDAERAYAEALYDMENIGVSIFDAARDYRVGSILRLRDLAVQRGLEVPPLAAKGSLDVARVRQMAEDGSTAAGIADALYADRQTVTRLCREKGIEVRRDRRGRRPAPEDAPPRPRTPTSPGALADWADEDAVPDGSARRTSSPWPAFVAEFAASGRRIASKQYATCNEAVNVAANIRRTARKAACPVTAVARLGKVYMSRTDGKGASNG